MRSSSLLCALALLSLVAGCAPAFQSFKMKQKDREKAARTYVGRDYVLASSLYITDFFGDREKLF
ncbi:hypothetical protein ACFL6C_13425, partial [Myxococcota bacterium]